MINKAIIIGRLGRDPDVKYTQDGKMITNFTVATDESYKKDGEKVQKTEWHRIVTFGKLAEICGEYLRKGSLVYVEGKIQTRQWEKDGEKRYTTEIFATTMQMLEKREKNETPVDDDTPF